MIKGTPFSQADLDAVSDNPEWTAETSARAKSFDETFPDLAPRRGPQEVSAKAQVTLRLDRRVIDYFRSTGDDWQGRVNDILKRAAGLDH